ncbi:9404_t:CDS:2 [Funneliformis geosporum]|nr:9404_t:CDS:2 [Funneliformis geosporum]
MSEERKRRLEQIKSEKENAYLLPTTPITETQFEPYPKTAACLIIGDEILNGKTVDTNSASFARFCYEHGIDLKRIEVIPDEEDTIIETVRRLSKNFDFVVTSGGIGPTHDDITYPTIAKAFNLSLTLHQQTLDRMKDFTNNTPSLKIMMSKQSQEVVDANQRMALFPNPSVIVYPNKTLWVPIVIVNGNIHILPGIPQLFNSLLFAFSKYLKVRQTGKDGEKFYRKFIKTYRPEGFIAPVLTEMHEKVKDLGIKIGSYPKWSGDKRWVVVSLLARENHKDKLEGLSIEIAKKIDGFLIDNADDAAVGVIGDKVKGVKL